MHAEALIGKLARGDAAVGVVGLGYVGIPLSLAFVRGGLRVVGFDLEAAKIEALLRGESYLRHLPAEEIAAALATGRFHASARMEPARECDALVICVPTPLTRAREPDLSAVIAAAESL